MKNKKTLKNISKRIIPPVVKVDALTGKLYISSDVYEKFSDLDNPYDERRFHDEIELITSSGKVYGYEEDQFGNYRPHSCYGGFIRADTFFGVPDEETIDGIRIPVPVDFNDISNLYHEFLELDLVVPLPADVKDTETYLKTKGLVFRTDIKPNILFWILREVREMLIFYGSFSSCKDFSNYLIVTAYDSSFEYSDNGVDLEYPLEIFDGCFEDCEEYEGEHRAYYDEDLPNEYRYQKSYTGMYQIQRILRDKLGVERPQEACAA